MALDLRTAGSTGGTARGAGSLRLLVFEDSVYRRQDGHTYTDQSFLWFVLHLCEHFAAVEVLGRLDPAEGRSHYRLPSHARLVPLPHYVALARPSALLAVARSLRIAWRALGRADVAWLMGPHPLALLLLVLAFIRGTPVVLGVRQDLPSYARYRHPEQPWTHRAADALEAAWQRAGRRHAVVAVGPALAHTYRHSRRPLELAISLISAADLDAPEVRGPYEEQLVVLSVGRLETEKNPLLLADVLSLLRRGDDSWRLTVCGEGPLQPELEARLRLLDVAPHAELRGYVPVDGGLRDAYLSSHALLHVSWTEGVPQVLFEAWAAGLPVVATDVGGVRAAAGEAALIVPPGNAEAAADALRRIATDAVERERLVAAGRALALRHTREAVLAELVDLLTSEASCAA